MNSKEYQLGVINSKISELLTTNDFETLKTSDNLDFIEYLFNTNLILSKELINDDLGLSLNHCLEDEVSKYIGNNHIIYKYFFDKDYFEIDKLNELFDKLDLENNLRVIFSKYHSIKNIILGLRMLDNDISFNEYKNYILNSDEYSGEFLEKSYKLGKNDLVSFSNSLYNLNLNISDNLVEIEKKLNKYFYSYIKEYSYSYDFYEVLLYYIFIRNRQNENLKSLYFMGDVYYEWTNIY